MLWWGAEISLLSNLSLTLPHFSDAWNALSLLWGRLIMLSGRYSRTVPESSLSPRWWRYGNQLSNGWRTAVVDKDTRQNQMLPAFSPIRSQDLGAWGEGGGQGTEEQHHHCQKQACDHWEAAELWQKQWNKIKTRGQKGEKLDVKEKKWIRRRYPVVTN